MISLLLALGIASSAPRTAPSLDADRTAPRILSISRKVPRCELPPIDPNSRLIVAGFYEGAGISTVSVAGLEEETMLGDIEVEAGREPLTLVLTSYEPMLYRLRGATQRIRSLILLNDHGAGVTGFPRARIVFGSAGACDLPYTVLSGPPGLFEPRIMELFGRRADYQGGTYELYRATVGSNGFRFESAEQPHRPELPRIEQEMMRFNPAGVVAVDPRQVVSSTQPVTYRVLPSTAGIREHLRSGALVPATKSDIDRWLVTAARTRRYKTTGLAGAAEGLSYNSYRVLRPIEVPIGLCGGHSVTLIAPDPSYLRGDGCHSSFLFDDGSAVGPSLPGIRQQSSR